VSSVLCKIHAISMATQYYTCYWPAIFRAFGFHRTMLHNNQSSFSTEEPKTKQPEMHLMRQLPPLYCYYADHSQFTPVLCLTDWTACVLQGVRLSFTSFIAF